MKSWLQNNDIELYLTDNEGKYVVAKRFITTPKNTIYKYMNLESKNMYINKLNDAVNNFNNTYQITIKI